MERRYAIYYAPAADSPLARFAAAWLGRSPEGYAIGRRPEIPEIANGSIDALVADPARYGFHGTLKPPFRLAGGTDEASLREASWSLAAEFAPFMLPALRLTAIGRFIALVPSRPSEALNALAAACVTRLDRFRAPSTEAELARRRQARLSDRQDALLVRWGYPYVLEEFQFHLTLTGSLKPDDQAFAMAALQPLVAPFCQEPVPVTDIALFVEPAPGAPFLLERRFRLAGPESEPSVTQAQDAAATTSG